MSIKPTKIKNLIWIFILISSYPRDILGQKIIDTCFTSSSFGTSFTSSSDLANLSSIGGDLLQWTGNEWIGDWKTANISIPPHQTNGGACRAIFIGNGSTWTAGGEGFGLRLDSPLVMGKSYSFDFTYVSHGTGSDGNFAPFIYTNDTTSLGGNVFSLGSLPSVGNSWATNTISFTASASQAGHNWLLLHTGPTGTSGLISSFCSICSDCSWDIPLGNDTSLCKIEDLILDAAVPGGVYLWLDTFDGSTFKVTQSGTYWVEVTANGCIKYDTIKVKYNIIPDLDLGSDSTLCEGDTVLLDVTTSKADYTWQNGSIEPKIVATQTDKYWVNVSIENCLKTDTINLVFNPYPEVDLGKDTSICIGDTIVLTPMISAQNYFWQDGSKDSVSKVTKPGYYWVTGTTKNCSKTDSIKIIENNDCQIVLTLPNIFTPNGDGVNDVLKPIEIKGISSMKTRIYNIWGMLVFETKDKMIHWSGANSTLDKQVSDGVYYWQIDYMDIYDRFSSVKGYVNLVR